MKTKEVRVQVVNGLPVVGLQILIGIGLGYWFFQAVSHTQIMQCAAAIILAVFWFVAWLGLFTLQPNEAAVLMLFGKYKGTATESGLRWANPFYTKTKVSQRARNINGTPIKVNDLRGNPIEIAAVVVWHVEDTAQAVFDVDRYEQYVTIQTESALRHLAMAYPYDVFEGDTLSLRGSTDEVSASLKTEIQDRVSKAGVVIDEARLSHLAYAQEIAAVMLQRQQAEAVVAARTRIVDGAVGMVEMALERLAQRKTIELDEERKAAMVSNLLVVLCGHEPARPVINTGTLYT
ncbi:MAG: SPFH domain-containing protein [Candidatus Hydrogenedentes bacterium]|nr:SPFH domain-containing protein [Candidatus Hydrogenedentota bacterium]